MDDRYKYFWTPSSGKTIEEYVKTVKPSIISDRDAPWIWVQGGQEKEDDPEVVRTQGEAIVEAKDVLTELQAQLDWAEQHTGFAKRAAKGVETKTSFRAKVHAEAAESLKKVSKKHKWTVGKWLLFPKHADVDRTWSLLAPSVASGPLRDAGVFLAKVAPTPADAGDFITHVVCLYMRDIYDLDVVRKVLKVLLKEHGLEPSAAKSDLYTLVGIDSNHPTKLRSSIWRVAEVLEGGKEEVQSLKSQYVPKTSSRSASEAPRKQTLGADGILDSDSEDEQISRKFTAEAGSKTKRAATPEDATNGHEKQEPQSKVKKARMPVRKSKAQMYQDNDIFAADSD